jgi:hypothetical protein
MNRISVDKIQIDAQNAIPKWFSLVSVNVYPEKDDEAMANAKLIAAAPDMLAMLIEIVEADNMELLVSHYKKAKTIIKKATE